MASKNTELLPAGESGFRTASNILRAGGLVAFPTETLYGLGADARNDAAVRKVFAAKARPSEKALIVLVRDFSEAARYGDLNDRARRLAEAFWPGALTLIVNRRDASGLSAEINPGGATIALRVPGSDIALSLLGAFAGPLTAPSANPSGVTPPTTAEQVMRGLGGAIDAVLDGGPCPGNESTIVDVSENEPRLLREGAISRDEIAQTLNPVHLR